MDAEFEVYTGKHLHWKGSGKASNSLLSIWTAPQASSLFSELEILKASYFSFFHVFPSLPYFFCFSLQCSPLTGDPGFWLDCGAALALFSTMKNGYFHKLLKA